MQRCDTRPSKFKEKLMFNDLPIEYRDQELVRNAYNAAFHELGLRWYWDADTYERLTRGGATPQAQLRHYLESQQPHLLKAYDAEFLIGVVLEKQSLHCERAAQRGPMRCRPFDWSQTLGGELGC